MQNKAFDQITAEDLWKMAENRHFIGHALIDESERLVNVIRQFEGHSELLKSLLLQEDPTIHSDYDNRNMMGKLSYHTAAPICAIMEVFKGDPDGLVEVLNQPGYESRGSALMMSMYFAQSQGRGVGVEDAHQILETLVKVLKDTPDLLQAMLINTTHKGKTVLDRAGDDLYHDGTTASGMLAYLDAMQTHPEKVHKLILAQTPAGDIFAFPEALTRIKDIFVNDKEKLIEVLDTLAEKIMRHAEMDRAYTKTIFELFKDDAKAEEHLSAMKDPFGSLLEGKSLGEVHKDIFSWAGKSSVGPSQKSQGRG